MFPRTIRGIIAAVGLGMGALTVLLGGATYYFSNRSLVAELDTRIVIESRTLLAIASTSGLPGLSSAVRAREAQPSVGNLGYIVVDGRGRHVAGSLRAKMPPPGFWDCLDYIRGDGSPAVAQSLNSAIPGGGRLVVAADRSIVDQADGTVVILFGSAFGLILLLDFASALLLGNIVKSRLARVATAAEAIMSGDLSKRIPIEHEQGEFDQLSTVFNRMLDRIETLLEGLRRLSAGIAHDIRSPLNRARGVLEAAEREAEGQAHQPIFAASIREVDEVLDLLHALLGISEIEGFAVRKRFVAVDLGALASDVVEGYRSVVEDAGMTITCAKRPVIVSGDPPLLRRALANLMDNAILYTPAGTHIQVGVTTVGDDALLIVQDDGPGVPLHERANIFDRFVRLDEARGTPGHGLGLNLVAAVASAHRGSVRTLPSESGLVIEIRIPIIRRAALGAG